MIYLIGGAPGVGKSVLCQRLAANLKIGWISTDLLMEVLRAKEAAGTKSEWNASREAITASAEWFSPCLERFVWGADQLADNYVIEGVDFLPGQVQQLSSRYKIRAVFLGCSEMTLTIFDQFPSCSRGYSMLPVEIRLQIVEDVPRWSAYIQEEAERFGYPYIDMANNFPRRLVEAEAMLTVS